MPYNPLSYVGLPLRSDCVAADQNIRESYKMATVVGIRDRGPHASQHGFPTSFARRLTGTATKGQKVILRTCMKT